VDRVKQLGWILAILVVVAAALSLPFIIHHAQPVPRCRSRVLILKGAHGEPLECVCIDGALSTCFNPGS
jgi:hypothetical protein